MLQAPWIHVDETSLRVDHKNHWIHVYSAGDITLKFCHRNRGREAIEAIGIIPRFARLFMIVGCLIWRIRTAVKDYAVLICCENGPL